MTPTLRLTKQLKGVRAASAFREVDPVILEHKYKLMFHNYDSNIRWPNS